MKKKLNYTKKILLILVLAISAFFFNSYALVNLYTSAVTEFASSNYGSTSIEIKNGKFTSHKTQGEGLPDSVDDWSVAEDVLETSTISGIINVDREKFSATKYNGIPKNPEKPGDNDTNSNFDNYILAMVSNGGLPTKYGYISSKINLDNDKFYAIRIFCKTDNGARASIYTTLSRDDEDVNTNNFVNISTNGRWEEYYFLVATDSFDTFNDFQIELRIGGYRETTSAGSVFFDQVEIVEIANRDFYSANDKTFNIKKLNFDNDYIEGFKNSDFENNLEGFTVETNNSDAKVNTNVYSASAINELLVKNFELDRDNYANNNTGIEGDNKELLIMNVDETATIIKTNEDNRIKIEQNGFYRLSLLMKTGNISTGGLDITLTNTSEIISGQDAISKSQTNLTSSSGGAYNGFTRVDFYIRGNAWKDCELEMIIKLGTEETKVSGWAIIDNITLQKISGVEYAKGSDTNQLNLSSNITDTSDITNGSFNFVSSKTSNITYPAIPQDWTASDNLLNNLINNKDSSGVIRVREEYFNKDSKNYGLYSYQNPGPNNSEISGLPTSAALTYENVLMVRNALAEDVYYKSSSSSNITLSENSISSPTIVKLSVAVKTLNNSKAFIKVVSGDDTIASIDQISANEWTTYSIYIKNGMASKNINLVLGTHAKENTGDNDSYAFFDHVTYKSSETDFNLTNFLSPKSENDIKKYKNAIYVDLLENGFYNHSNQIVSGNVYKQDSLLVYKNEENSAQYNGIINTAGNDSLKVREDAIDKNILVINNSTPGVQILKTIDTYELTENSYYEFSVWMKTSTLTGVGNNFGAYFELVSIDEEGNIIENSSNKNKFTNISVTETENNGWVKYSIYVLAETKQNVKVLLGLGNENCETQGSVYFDDLRIVEIDQAEYASVKQDKNTLVSKVIEEPKEEDDNNSSNDGENNNDNGINIWALLSSIILVIALILAIVGYSIRKIPKRKIAKIKAGEYEKSPFAVDEYEIKRELKLSREQKVVDLNKELEQLEQQKIDVVAKYEKETKDIQDEKEKNKVLINQTKDINKIDKQIAYLQSALTYITDPVNIRNEETRIINERKKQSKEEFIKIKQDELEKEQAKLEAETDESSNTGKVKKKKYNKFSKTNNKNKGK